ncbi:hypothetical protein [Streptomyces sp. NPDC049949]|uniref:hypothetical protein n=1 Tax=Streptomyces sp. NPDC049949 TaxID=3154627 RepID=UPI00342C3960
MNIAMQWAELPPEHLKIALKAMEPQLARDHELLMEQLRLSAQAKSEGRVHHLYMGGLIAGFGVVAGMLSAAVIVGIHGQAWLAAMLAGPSVLSLAGLFVLRKVDSGASKDASRATRSALNAASLVSPSSAVAAVPPDPNATGGVMP